MNPYSYIHSEDDDDDRDDAPSASVITKETANGVTVQIPIGRGPDRSYEYYRPDLGPQYENVKWVGFQRGPVMYEEIKGQHSMKAYDVLPTGRIVAGSKRVAKAKEISVPPGAKNESGTGENDDMERSSAEQELTAFEGSGGMQVDQASSSGDGSQPMQTS